MPLPAFMSRKGSSASRKFSGANGVITEGSTSSTADPSHSESSSSSSSKPRLTIPGLGLGRSSSKSQNVSRSPSLYSFRSGGGDRGSTAPPTPNVVSHETFINGLPPQASVPASRRMPSSSGSLGGPADELQQQSTASPLPSPALSKSSRDGAATSSSSYVHVPSAAGLAAAPVIPAGLTPLSPLSAGTGDRGSTSGPATSAQDSDSDSDDDDANETYESPDEFSDSELADLAADSHISTPAPLPSAPAAKQDGGYVVDHEESNHDSAIGQTERNGPVPSGAALAELAQPQASDTPVQADLRQIWHAISLFLNSQMVTAEEICETRYTERLYYSLGYSMIASMKAMMTFEPKDLAAAVDICKVCLNLANTQKNDWSHAARGLSWSERISGSVTGAVKGSSLTVEMLQRMSMEQRHAELAYAECLLIKAIVTLLYAGDFLAFIREALNMRASSAVYRVLGRFLAVADATDPSGYDASIDLDFRSGIEYGTGSTALILSLLPASAVKVMELFGFHGNREQALQTLMRTGGWAKRDKGPTIGEGPGKEGLRRPVCDLTLLMYHLIISSLIPVTDVDIDLADRILHYNLEKYPQGSFWLYFSGRLYSTQSLGKRAVGQYSKAIKSQTEYRQIQHICNWDLSITYLSLAEYSLAYDNLTILAAESNWSKAAYGYSQAVSLYESLTANGGEQQDDVSTSAVPVAPMRAKSAHEQQEEVSRIMGTIPGYLKKIAGKSLPFEKFVVRKSKKYLAQDGRLCLPGLELGYMLNSLNLSPRYALVGRHLRQVDDTLNAQKAQYSPESGLEAPAGWWDDYLLASFMKGVILHLIVLPEKHIKLDPPTSPIAEAEGVQQALACFRTVLDNSLKLELDHQIAYFAHYEYARLLTKLGSEHHAEAKTHLAAVLEGKVQLGPSKGKGKVSLQNVAVIRANAAMDLLKAA